MRSAAWLTAWLSKAVVDGHQAYGRGGWNGFEQTRTNRGKQHPLAAMYEMLGKRLRIAWRSQQT